jgi:hypothetical protein
VNHSTAAWLIIITIFYKYIMKYPQLVSMPSAVSDWLEEQLEARGIDAVVYTRYILSLLHSDTVDVIYSDEDLHFSHLKKEVRRSGGGRKRVRRSSDWWKHAQADAEKLKRSAAVECLMSASEQTCGIESLIDELCEKLNEIKSDVHNVDPPATKVNPELQQVSPQELAKRYYAAFPPLNRNTSSTSPSKLISLIPKWIQSPKKKPINSRKQNNRSYEDMMKASRTVGKQRYGAYCTGRNNNNNNKKEIGHQNDTDWNNMFKKSRVEAVPKTEELKTDWNMNEDVNLYDDLPVDIKELLDDDSPTSHDVTVEMMNLANMRDTGRRGFIPCGTNITSSIWTNEAAMEEDTVLFDNNYNSVLDLQFGSITISKSQPDLVSVQLKSYFDNSKNVWNLSSGPWSNDSGCFEEDHVANHFTLSLMKLKHSRECSAFAEVIPRNHTPHLKPFSKVIGSGIHRDTSLKTVDLDKEKDDLLTSVHSHFRPINEKVENYLQGQYADGATFLVSNSWDKINYQRTESGAMYMENDYSMRKKYCEYKMKNAPTKMEFVLKYLVCQNDKGCQTEDADAEVEAINSERQLKDGNRADDTAAEYNCTCRTLATNSDYSISDCHVHSTRSDSAAMSEGVWQQQSCTKCNDDSTFWNTNGDGLKNVRRDLGWQFGTMSKIWSGGEVCHACLGRPPSTLQHSKLREDVSQDGDQLLSDLSTIQKSYMQENLPLTEFTCDIASFFDPIERKRRHSLTVTQMDDSWSFASRLEEDCLIQMSTMPTLRSVTL